MKKNNIFYEKFECKNPKNTIIILHWWWWSSQSWLGIAKKLQENNYNVIIPDLAWFWKTKLEKIYNLDDYAEDIENFVNSLELKNFILWWHSNWWAISIKLAIRNNLKISDLVLNNSAWIRNDRKRSLKRKILNNFAKIFKIFKKIPGFWKLRELFYRAIWSQDYLKAEKNPFLKQTYLNMISSDLKKDLKKIKEKTLLIWWEKDNYTPISDWKIMKNEIKNSKLIILTSETHWIHLKNPNLLLKTFLKNI